MRYVSSPETLRALMASVHALPRVPALIVIDDLDVIMAAAAGDTGAQACTYAMMHDAGRYLGGGLRVVAAVGLSKNQAAPIPPGVHILSKWTDATLVIRKVRCPPT